MWQVAKDKQLYFEPFSHTLLKVIGSNPATGIQLPD